MRVVVFIAFLGLSNASWYLNWQDEFEGDSIDSSKWSHEITCAGGGNNEFQVYTPAPENSFVKNGKLHIKPTLLKDNVNPQTGQQFGPDYLANGRMNLWDMYGSCTNDNNWGCYREGPTGDIPPFASARLRTAGKFSFLHGKVEISAKMPAGDWMWPAIWMLPENWVYGGWPRSGEIDIVEAIGNRDFSRAGSNPPDYYGIQKAASTLHWGVSPNDNRYYLTGRHRTSTEWNFADHFHKYTLDWSPKGIQFYLDDIYLVTIPEPLIDENPGWRGFYEYGKPWSSGDNPWANPREPLMVPFDQSFHFLLNVAVGGTNGFIPDNGVNRGGGANNKPWRNGVSQKEGMWKMYESRQHWYDTWNEPNDNSAMQIDYIRVYQWRQ